MRISSNMISRASEDLENNPFYKKKVDDANSDENKKEEVKSIAISKDVIAEQIEDTVVLSKIGPNGHKEQLRTVSSDSDLGRELTGAIEKENMTEEDVLKEQLKEITMNSKRLSLSNYI